MDLGNMEVVNHEAYGELIIAWSKGTVELPRDLEEFSAQLTQANVGAKIPGRIKQVKFVHQDDETIVVRLPSKQVIADAEVKVMSAAEEYTLPAFYEQIFGSKPRVEDRRALQAARIGDYTVSTCG